jgi:hypothetical protein
MYCRYCGKEVAEGAVVCVGCGRSPFLDREAAHAPGREATHAAGVSPKSRLAAAILAWFVGYLGVWALVDLVLIVARSMTDSDGLAVSDWSLN